MSQTKGLQVGDVAPDFTLSTADATQINLYQTLDKTRVVLFFFLKAFTPLCISEVCHFQAQLPQFESAGAAVFGISSDSETVARQFRKSFSLSYPLLVDSGGQVRRSYQVPRLLGLLPGRSTFVIGLDRRIASVTHSHGGHRIHIEESLQFVRES